MENRFQIVQATTAALNGANQMLSDQNIAVLLDTENGDCFLIVRHDDGPNITIKLIPATKVINSF